MLFSLALLVEIVGDSFLPVLLHESIIRSSVLFSCLSFSVQRKGIEAD